MNKELQFTGRIKSSKGFTLIEGIIASGIISTALIVGLALAYSNLTAAQANADRITAIQLAREGMEVMRNIRDSNWLRRQANIDKITGGDTQFYEWDDFFDGWPIPASGVPSNCTQGDCGNYFDVLLMNYTFGVPTTHNYELHLVTSSNKDPLTCISDPLQPTCRVHKTNDGVYYQAESSSDPATPFYRRILLQPICWDGSLETVDFDVTAANMLCPVTQTKIGVLVTATVVWRRGEKILEVQEKERLYNWRTTF